MLTTARDGCHSRRVLFMTVPETFQFLDPGPLIDGELELVAPDAQWVEDMLAAIEHPLTAQLDPQASQASFGQLMRFLDNCPAGLQGPDAARGIAPAYHLWMRLRPESDPPVPMAGAISLRLGNSEDIQLYYGHIGYNVFPPARGRHCAERACRLVLPLARRHGLRTLWITCNPDNLPSRRTCERLGAVYIETVPVPSGNVLYRRGEKYKCRYRLDL